MIHGLKKVWVNEDDELKSELVDARFIWTEPHSRRIIVELDIKKELENQANIIVSKRQEVGRTY